MKKIIYAFVIYDQVPEFTKYTLKTISNYADQVGADLKIISQISQLSKAYPKAQIILDKGSEFPHFYKLYALEEFAHSSYDKMMLIDDDILVRKNAFDLFEFHINGHFLASQHICENGKNHLAVIEKEQLSNLLIETIIRLAKAGPAGEFLVNQLRNIINSGLYVVDKDAAIALTGAFSAPIDDYSVFGWYDQGYLIQKIGEAKIKCQEIPAGIHSNPILSNSSVKGNTICISKNINIDFLHFNGISLEKKNSLIKEIFLSSDIF